MKSYNELKKEKEVKELIRSENITITEEPIVIIEKDTILTVGERIAKFAFEMFLVVGGIAGLCAAILFIANRL